MSFILNDIYSLIIKIDEGDHTHTVILSFPDIVTENHWQTVADRLRDGFCRETSKIFDIFYVYKLSKGDRQFVCMCLLSEWMIEWMTKYVYF